MSPPALPRPSLELLTILRAPKPRKPGAKKPTVEIDNKGNKTVTEYDEDGHIKKISKYGPGLLPGLAGPLEKTVERTPDGGIIEKIYKPDGSVSRVYIYDSEGRLRISYSRGKDAAGNDVVTWTFYDKLDEKGAVIHSQSYTQTTDPKTGRTISREEEEWDFGVRRTYHVDYDNKGKATGGTVTEEEYLAGGRKRKTVTKYDGDGDVTEEDSEVTDGQGRAEKASHEDYKNGKRKSRVTQWFKPPGNKVREIETEWNDDGTTKSRTVKEFLNNGTTTEKTTTYERDAQGNVEKATIHEVESDKNGVVVKDVTHTVP